MRDQYQQQLDDVLAELVEMTGSVRLPCRRPPTPCSTPTRRRRGGHRGDLAIDAARERIEDESFEILARQSPVAGDLRMLVASLRMVADLERMGDLSVHVAKVARLRYPAKAVPAVLDADDHGDGDDRRRDDRRGRARSSSPATSMPRWSSRTPTTRWTSCAARCSARC